MFANLVEKRKWIILFASLFFVVIIFTPAAKVLFLGGEDTRYVFGGEDKLCGADDGFYFMMALGRPIQAYMDCLSFKFGYTLERMRYIRFISVALLGIGMGLLVELIYSFGTSLFLAFTTAAAIFLIQKLYGDTVQLGALSLPVSMLFAILAYTVLANAQQKLSNNSQSAAFKLGLLASTLLFCSLLTYPALTFFFCSLILARILFSPLANWEITKVYVRKEITFFIFVCLTYFIYAYINMHLNTVAIIPDNYRIDKPTLNPIEMAIRGIQLLNPFGGAWLLIPTLNMAWQGSLVIVALLIGSLVLGYNITKCRKNAKIYMQFGLYTIGIYLCSCIFFLIIPVRDSIWSRLAFAATSSNMIIMIYVINRIFMALNSKSLKTLLIGVFSLALYSMAWHAMTNTAFVANNQAAFNNGIAQSIADYQATHLELKRIHFIISREDYPYTNFFLAAGAMTQIHGHEKYKLEWCSLPRGIPGQEKDNQEKMLACLHALPQETIAVTYSYENDPFVETKGMHIIRPKSLIM